MTSGKPVSKHLQTPLIQDQYALLEYTHHPQEREHFSDYFGYTLSVVGFAAGYGSFWRFPSLVYEHGGGAFLIPYITIMILLGVPLLYLQTIIGQMNQTTIPKMFQRVNNALKMFGYIIIFIAFGVSVYYNTLLTYSYRFLFVCFMNPLPFLDEPATSNQYFRNNILHKSGSINQFGQIHWELAILFIVSLYICYEVIRRGVEAAGKILVVTVIAPYVFLVLLILRAAPLEGAYNGLKYLFSPNFSKIFTAKIWVDATVQVFFQLSIASAGLINFASLKKKTQPFMSIIYIVPLSLIVCGLLCGATIFMYVGHFCQLQNLQINDLTLSGQQLAFSVVPKAISSLPWANFWLFIFSVILIMLGIDTQFGFMEAVVGAVQQDLKQHNNKIFGVRLQTKHLYIILTVIMCLFFPFFTCSAGIYYVDFFDTFNADINLPLGAFIQLYVFVYLFDFDSLQKQVQKYVGCKTPWFIRWALKSKVIILILGGILLLGLLEQIFIYEKYTTKKYLLGWFITLYPSLIAVIYWKLYKNDYYRLTFQQIEEYQKNSKAPASIELM